MRVGALAVAIAVTTGGAARADDLGLHGDVEVGLVIGGARIHHAGGMLYGGTVAAGVSWHQLSLLGTFDGDGFIPTEENPSVAVYRLGWRARYDPELGDEPLGKLGWRSKWSWYLDAGTGEQLITWDATDSHRADLEFGTGFSLLAYNRHENLLGPAWGLTLGFELTSAAALAALPPSYAGDAVPRDTNVMTPAASSGRENAYLFTFSCRFL